MLNYDDVSAQVGVEGEAWRRRQRLFAWERELVELLLQNVTL